MFGRINSSLHGLSNAPTDWWIFPAVRRTQHIEKLPLISLVNGKPAFRGATLILDGYLINCESLMKSDCVVAKLV